MGSWTSAPSGRAWPRRYAFFPGLRGAGPEFRPGTSARITPDVHDHIGNENWTQTFFSQTFRAPPGYPGKIPGYPAKKVWFPWFRGTYRTFWPPPLHVEDPHPTRKYPHPKVQVWVPFLRLTIIHHENLFFGLSFCSSRSMAANPKHPSLSERAKPSPNGAQRAVELEGKELGP